MSSFVFWSENHNMIMLFRAYVFIVNYNKNNSLNSFYVRAK